MKPHTMGPIKQKLNRARGTLECLAGNKHWFAGGYRSAAVAAQLILKQKIIAIPTDTIYGLAGLAQCYETVEKLYEIKKRDLSKPLSICLWNIDIIKDYAEVDHLPKDLIKYLLPGPTTILLERKDILNPILNEGIKTVGIRVPNSNFVLSLARMVQQPIALTSANISQDKSTVHPSEFEHLWPELDGIFYNAQKLKESKSSKRAGSTIVDLSVRKEYKIVRKGNNYMNVQKILDTFQLQEQKDDEVNEEHENKKCENTKIFKSCA